MWVALLVFLMVVGLNVIISVYVERKLSAFIQDRLGPMEVGKWGLLQLVADLIKLLQKEDIIPTKADRLLFKTAPYIIFAAIFSGFALFPINSTVQGANLQTGLMVILGVISLDVLGIIMAGWASNNKYSLLGAMRSIAQILAYEIPMGVILLSVIVICGTLNLQEISIQQGIFSEQNRYLIGLPSLKINVTEWGGVLAWNIFASPLMFIAFIIFFIAGLAEANRAPFDLPEAESELIAGYHTEYSGFRWAILFLAEYGMMLLLSILGVVLFLGSWNSALPNLKGLPLAKWTSGKMGTGASYIWGAFWLFSKSYFLMLIQMWVRWTLPRLRIDQLLYLCWKVLLPFSIGLLLFHTFWKTLSL